jgi:hypothetical protein
MDYKKDFGFIDFDTPVRDRALVETLDAIAFAELTTMVEGGESDLHIALPDKVNQFGTFPVGTRVRSVRGISKNSALNLSVEECRELRQ